MLDADRVNAYMERGTIEVAPLAFMRGRTLNDSFVILDEAQNTTPEQMHMFLTRLGFGSKIVVTGDVTQVDLPREQTSGLVRVREILADVEGIEFVELGDEDVVRHVLVQRIVEAYKPARRERGRARRDPVEVENRSGAAVDEDEAVELCARDARGGGRRRRRPGTRVRRPRRDARAQARAPRASTRRPTCSRSRSTGASRSPDGVPRQLGDVVLCPDVVGRGVALAARPRAPAPARLRPRRRHGGAARRSSSR